ncbi:MAG: hypothetical protein AAF572_19115 [Cyanobacteria bacterium P01_B01_bin.77]
MQSGVATGTINLRSQAAAATGGVAAVKVLPAPDGGAKFVLCG